MEQLNIFFSRIKELTFWQRIFHWKPLRLLSYDAFEEFKMLNQKLNDQTKIIEQLKTETTKLEAINESLRQIKQESEKSQIKKEAHIERLNHEISGLTTKVSELEKKLSLFESTKEQRSREHEQQIAQFNQAKDHLESRRKEIEDERLLEQQVEFDRKKSQWAAHEDDVANAIKIICKSHVIEYVEKVPFKGNPDNTLLICDEHIIFDAKSPSNNDLTNFPKYIKAQAESVAKYARQENVRKDIFFVVPSNTLDVVSEVTFSMADYNVYIITKDSLEPVILSLQKIEEYEFAEQLSPEDRDNICRFLGKLVHATKRNIQLGQFMNNHLLEVLQGTFKLPSEILDKVHEFERAEKLNPPIERRAKEIKADELADRQKMLDAHLDANEISIPQQLEDLQESA